MNEGIHNSGFMVTGGSTANIGQVAAGPGAGITNYQPAPQPAPAESRSRAIGVVTIKATEARALIDTFGLRRERERSSGQELYSGTVDSADGAVDLVAARTLEQGQRSIMSTLQNLRRHCDPALFVLVGIGGGISKELSVGDVVVSTRVVYYELRRETADGVRRRGEERHAPAVVTHGVNNFFDDCGEPARLRMATGSFRVLPGPIGSGEAVIMDAANQIRKFLTEYNEKVLAIDMEAGGLAQFCHESAGPRSPGWLVIRGISDLADSDKSDDQQPVAAHNAATTLKHLLPYLPAAS